MLGCSKTENGDCVSIKSNKSFIEEDFKDGYSISFPSEYTRNGLFRGMVNDFEKQSPSGINFSFSSGGSWGGIHQYFRDSIPSSSVESVSFDNRVLTQKVDFCIKNEHEMVFFHNSEGPSSFGMLYMKVDGVYREALYVYFDITLLPEVTSVLRTIRKH